MEQASLRDNTGLKCRESWKIGSSENGSYTAGPGLFITDDDNEYTYILPASRELREMRVT